MEEETTTEIWKDIPEYESLYQISSLGRVKSLKFGKERILKPIKNNKGYFVLNLLKDGKPKNMKVHRLVAQAFLNNPFNLPQINHINEIKEDNRLENLEYCDNIYNSNYGTRNERVSKSNINNSKRSKQVICIETCKIYPSTADVHRQLGFSQSSISACCIGKRNTCGGYHWQYV